MFELVGRTQPRQDHDELVPADSGDGVLNAHLFLEPPADLDEHLVPDVVAKPVVDRLELVEVEVGQAEDVAEPAGVSDRRGEPLVELGAVRQAR